MLHGQHNSKFPYLAIASKNENYIQGKQNIKEQKTKNAICSLTGALFGNVAIPIDIKPFSTLVKASISNSVGSPKCTVLVVSAEQIFFQIEIFYRN